jgi:hypothetical protein
LRSRGVASRPGTRSARPSRERPAIGTPTAIPSSGDEGAAIVPDPSPASRSCPRPHNLPDEPLRRGACACARAAATFQAAYLGPAAIYRKTYRSNSGLSYRAAVFFCCRYRSYTADASPRKIGREILHDEQDPRPAPRSGNVEGSRPSGDLPIRARRIRPRRRKATPKSRIRSCWSRKHSFDERPESRGGATRKGSAAPTRCCGPPRCSCCKLRRLGPSGVSDAPATAHQ